MESNDIKKALEDWIKNYDGSYVNFKILGNALDLIIRQQTENENLKVENQSLRSAANSLKMHYEEAQAEIENLKNENLILSQKRANIFEITDAYERGRSKAVKEFAERAKEFIHNKFKALDEYEFEYITERDINNIVKELEGKV